MYKVLLLLTFTLVQVNANKNWIDLEPAESTSNFVMAQPSSSKLRNSSRVNIGKRDIRTDESLLKLVRTFQDVIKKIPYERGK